MEEAKERMATEAKMRETQPKTREAEAVMRTEAAQDAEEAVDAEIRK